MDLLGLIKEKLTSTVVEKISGFLGEHPEKINSALNSAIPTVMGGIIQKANSSDDTGKLLDILRDGGHTGEILDDFSSLLGSFDKTQMLITIGSNIANHFLGDKTNNIIETLSTVSGIRKTSSSSLLGLSTPLVLGAIGKVVAKEGLGISGLTQLLNEQKESIQKALPPALFNQLDIKNISTPISTPTTIFESKTEAAPATKVSPAPVITQKKTSSTPWIPWVLLLLLGIGALAWVKGFKNYFTKHSKGADSVKVTSSPMTTPSSSIPSSSMDSSKTLQSHSVDTDTKATITHKTDAPKPVVSVQKTETVIKSTPKKQHITPTISSEKLSGSLSEKLESNSDIWIGLNQLSFKNRSAELTKKGQISDLANYLKNHPKNKIKIGGYSDGGKTLAEDRAYAVRESLMENGISESRVQVQSGAIGTSSNSKVAVKVIRR